MWRIVSNDGVNLGMNVNTVGELKEMLNYVPNDYELSAMGTDFAMLVNDEEKTLLVDEADYLEGLLEEDE